jgi:hypothetical protein
MDSTPATATSRSGAAHPSRQTPVRQVVKVTANLPLPVFDALQEIARKRGISMTEALRQAISTEKFVEDVLDRGDTIMVENKEKDVVREVIFKR